MFSLVDLFTNPLLGASTLATLCMSVACAMLGGLLFVKKTSLLGETLSHAAYPGVVLGLIVALSLPNQSFDARFIYMLVFGLIFAFLGDRLVKRIEKFPAYFPDMALSVVLASFFGVGVFLSSLVQYKWPMHFSSIPIFLFGQLATLTDLYAKISFLFLALVCVWFVLAYRKIEVVLFDKRYAENLGVASKKIELILTLFIATAIVIGIRALGAVLISGMFIAPAIGARILTRRFGSFLFTCAILAFVSTVIGIYFSLNLPTILGIKSLMLPTGPVVLLSSSIISLMCLLLSPRGGVATRFSRGMVFNWRCGEENVLKTLWKNEKEKRFTFYNLRKKISISPLRLWAFLISLRLKRKIAFDKRIPFLTKRGKVEASNIVRVHRLWELYLYSCLGVSGDKVHNIAEEIEHVSSEKLTSELTQILKNPLRDPHNQPIPKEAVHEPL